METPALAPGQTLASQSLAGYLATQDQADASLHALILALAATCAEISALVARGALGDVLGSAGAENVQGEVQKKLDVISNDMLVACAEQCGQVAAVGSEELEDVIVFPEGQGRGRHLLLFDPLDGSSNIDVNVSIGTIFSILPAPSGRAATAQDFLQGRARPAGGGLCALRPPDRAGADARPRRGGLHARSPRRVLDPDPSGPAHPPRHG